jgi:putative membrane protein
MLRVVGSIVLCLLLLACGESADRSADTDVPPSSTTAADSLNAARVGTGSQVAEAMTLAGVSAADTTGFEPVGDSGIVAMILTADSLEMETGKLGQTRGEDAGVKDLARMLETDHAKSRQDMQSLAKRLGLTPRAQPSDTAKAHHQRVSQKLQGLSGADFDSLYAHEGVRHHAHDVAAVRAMAAQATNGELRSHLQNAVLPALQSHLEKAAQLTMMLRGSATSSGDTAGMKSTGAGADSAPMGAPTPGGAAKDGR